MQGHPGVMRTQMIHVYDDIHRRQQRGGGGANQLLPFRILKKKKNIEVEKREEIYQILKPKLTFLKEFSLLF
jgi:hypothetical protein